VACFPFDPTHSKSQHRNTPICPSNFGSSFFLASLQLQKRIRRSETLFSSLKRPRWISVSDRLSVSDRPASQFANARSEHPIRRANSGRGIPRVARKSRNEGSDPGEAGRLGRDWAATKPNTKALSWHDTSPRNWSDGSVAVCCCASHPSSCSWASYLFGGGGDLGDAAPIPHCFRMPKRLPRFSRRAGRGRGT
jgi:hypothetical protein